MVEETEQLVEEAAATPKVNPEIDSKYRMIILAAQRSKQLQRGANPRVDMDPRKSKATRIAMRELEDGKVDFEIIPNPILGEKSNDNS
ncbi:MAG: DNA-directed RNA polymerase subunit omega [Pyrinomonadaceae bacterium]|nr:DNA-directed RNA polymerase subunit omega [Pyrinomonadaceae bacterium]